MNCVPSNVQRTFPATFVRNAPSESVLHKNAICRSLDVVGVLAHPPRLVELRADDGLARVELLASVVQVDEPVPPLQRRQLGGWIGLRMSEGFVLIRERLNCRTILWS